MIVYPELHPEVYEIRAHPWGQGLFFNEETLFSLTIKKDKAKRLPLRLALYAWESDFGVALKIRRRILCPKDNQASNQCESGQQTRMRKAIRFHPYGLSFVGSSGS
jgi:hypothetical protein